VNSAHPDPPRKQPAVLSRLTNPTLIASVLLSVATILAYWPVVHAEFINYDDTDYVLENPHVLGGITWKGVAWAFTSNHASNWHPLTWFSHMTDVQLFGPGPTGPHCINLLLHVLNSLLLFSLLKRMTACPGSSFFVAALFALHPAHVESVAWVSERKDVLSTFFWMLTLLAYVHFVEHSRAGRPRRVLWYCLALGCFALGLMSKPMLVTLPCVMLLLDYWPLQRMESAQGTRLPLLGLRLAVEKTPFFILSAVSCTLTSWAQQEAMQPLALLPLPERISNAAVAYVGYLGQAFWPANLALPYLHPGQWPTSRIVFAMVVILVVSALAMSRVRKLPHLFVGWFWYLGTLVPVIGLVQVGIQSMADRYTYIPLIGIFVLVVWTVANWAESRTSFRVASAGFAALALAACGGLTYRQAGCWRNSVALFQHSAAVTKDNFVALGNIGGALFQERRLEEAMNYYQRSYQANPRYAESVNSIGAVLAAKGQEAEALEWFHKTLELQPRHADALFNLGNAMAKTGRPAEAVPYFHSALAQRPENHEARNNLGNVLVKLNRLDEAIEQYQRALDCQPNAALIHKNLGEALAAKGKLDEAILQYHEALSRTNDAGTHYSLAMTLAVQAKWAEAIEHYRATIRLSPTNAEAHYNLGYALRVRGDLPSAREHLSEALRLKPEFPLAHFNLACVLADQNQLEEAQAHLREALSLKPDYDDARKKLQALDGDTTK
jgi:protein O-mannosyl-transferase